MKEGGEEVVKIDRFTEIINKINECNLTYKEWEEIKRELDGYFNRRQSEMIFNINFDVKELTIRELENGEYVCY